MYPLIERRIIAALVTENLPIKCECGRMLACPGAVIRPGQLSVRMDISSVAILGNT